MPTSISSLTPYATAAQLLSRFDARVVADLVSDNETLADVVTLKDSASVPGGKVYTALQDASGDIEAACLVGKRYTTADLATLAGNGAATLQRLTTTLAMDYLFQRRCDPTYQANAQVKQAHEFLNALAEGERIFGLLEQAEAGLPYTETETASQVEARNMVSFQAERLFGRRANRRGA